MAQVKVLKSSTTHCPSCNINYTCKSHLESISHIVKKKNITIDEARDIKNHIEYLRSKPKGKNPKGQGWYYDHPIFHEYWKLCDEVKNEIDKLHSELK